MSSLQLLEERISELEKKVYGSDKTMQDVNPPSSVIENILNANTMISSALKGREKMNTLIKRLPELNSYLDNSLDDGDMQSDAKLKVLLTLEADMKENLETIKRMQSLMPVLETDKIKDIPELSEKLNTFALNYLNTNDEVEELNKNVNEMYTKYNNILSSTSEVLITLDAIITSAEVANISKK